MNENEKRMERKVEKAKNPTTRVIRAMSVELKTIAGRLEIADSIVYGFRAGGGLKYPKKTADKAIEDFKAICREIDAFNEKYYDLVKRNEEDKYKPLSWIDEGEEK